MQIRICCFYIQTGFVLVRLLVKLNLIPMVFLLERDACILKMYLIFCLSLQSFWKPSTGRGYDSGCKGFFGMRHPGTTEIKKYAANSHSFSAWCISLLFWWKGGDQQWKRCSSLGEVWFSDLQFPRGLGQDSGLYRRWLEDRLSSQASTIPLMEP